MNKLLEDLSILTTIPQKTLEKLVDKTYLCINSSVEETLLEDKNISEIDIGIGYLYILLDYEGIKNKFIPNQKLEDSIKKTFINKSNMLENTLEISLVDRISNTYKDLL